MTNNNEFIGRQVPPHLFEYALKNSANFFWYKTTFRKGKNEENPIAVTWTRNRIVRTEYELPGLMKWSEVVEQKPLKEASPLVTSVAMMQETNWKNEMMWKKLEEDNNSVPLNDLTQCLYGVVLPQVGGGVPKLEEAFLTEEYAKEHPDEEDLIEGLKKEIVKQVDIIDHLLVLFEKLRGQEQKLLSTTLAEHHMETKERVQERYWKPDDDMYKVNIKANPKVGIFISQSNTCSFSSRNQSSTNIS